MIVHLCSSLLLTKSNLYQLKKCYETFKKNEKPQQRFELLGAEKQLKLTSYLKP
jgi:hypothetical protein